jgi:hypothetical protein
MGYPKRHPRFSHLGKNLELVIDKALQENDPEKKAAFANSIAYYMKLSYSNWHKELVHDETIRTELDAITGGQLEFSNTPYIKHRPAQPERSDYGGRRQQNFGGRNNRSGDNRGGNNGVRNNNNRSNDGRVAGNRNGDNRSGGGGLRNNNNPSNRNFKKRF